MEVEVRAYIGHRNPLTVEKDCDEVRKNNDDPPLCPLLDSSSSSSNRMEEKAFGEMKKQYPSPLLRFSTSLIRTEVSVSHDSPSLFHNKDMLVVEDIISSPKSSKSHAEDMTIASYRLGIQIALVEEVDMHLLEN